MVKFDANDCIDALHEVAETLGKSPTRAEYDDNRPDTAPSGKTIQDRLGGWNAAKDAAGLAYSDQWDDHDFPVNEHYFDTLDAESAYWLGFLHADAHMQEQGRGRLSLYVAVQDAHHLRAFANTLDSEYTIRETTNGSSEQIGTTLGGRHLMERLRELGVTSGKSHEQTIPVELLEDRRLEYPFIRGYWDGDGSYREQGKRSNWALHGAHEPRLRVVLAWLRAMGVYGGGVYGGNESSRLVVSAEPDLEIMRNRLYPDGHDTEPALDRKRKVFLN